MSLPDAFAPNRTKVKVPKRLITIQLTVSIMSSFAFSLLSTSERKEVVSKNAIKQKQKQREMSKKVEDGVIQKYEYRCDYHMNWENYQTETIDGNVRIERKNGVVTLSNGLNYYTLKCNLIEIVAGLAAMDPEITRCFGDVFLDLSISFSDHHLWTLHTYEPLSPCFPELDTTPVTQIAAIHCRFPDEDAMKRCSEMESGIRRGIRKFRTHRGDGQWNLSLLEEDNYGLIFFDKRPPETPRLVILPDLKGSCWPIKPIILSFEEFMMTLTPSARRNLTDVNIHGGPPM